VTSVEQPPETQASKLQLTVGIELAAALAEHAGDELRDAVLSYVRGLVDDLGIPAEPAVAVAPRSEDAADVDAYAIRIGDRVCLPALPVPAAETWTAERLARAVAGTMAANRRLLLTPAITEQLVRDWQARSPLVAQVTASPEEFGELLRDLVHRCISVAPREVTAASDVPIDSADALGELIIEAWHDPSVTVYVEPVLAASMDASSPSLDYELSGIGDSLLVLLVDELGLLLPSARFETDAALSGGTFRFRVNAVRFPPMEGLHSDEVLVPANLSMLADHGVTGRRLANPLHGGEAAAVTADDETLATLVAAGFFTVRPRAFIAFAIRRELLRLAGSLLTTSTVMFQLSRLRESDSLAVEAALDRFGPYLLTAVFRRLLDEAIPTRNMVGLLEGMLAVGAGIKVDHSLYDVVAPDTASIWRIPDGSESATPDAAEYADCVRRHLRWEVTRFYADDKDQIRALGVDARWESRIRRTATPLGEDERAALRGEVWKAYEPIVQSETQAVTLTNSEVRRELRRLLETDFPALQVLSHDEVAPGTGIQWIGKSAWP
jgi:FHIPEP family